MAAAPAGRVALGVRSASYDTVLWCQRHVQPCQFPTVMAAPGVQVLLPVAGWHVVSGIVGVL